MVKAFVIWHLYAMTAFSLPAPPRVLTSGAIQPTVSSLLSDPMSWLLYANFRVKTSQYSPLYWYMVPTGLWQYWDMFAPNPSQMDVFLDGVITYQDGSTKVHIYPRMSAMPYPERYVKERFRKYVERINPDTENWKRPALAQWMALQAATDPKNLPVQVELRRQFHVIPRYGKPQPQEDTVETMAVYQVDLEKLKRDKGW